MRSGKGATAETSRAASVVPNEDEASWTDVNLDEQKDEQQQQGGVLLNCNFFFKLRN